MQPGIHKPTLLALAIACCTLGCASWRAPWQGAPQRARVLDNSVPPLTAGTPTTILPPSVTYPGATTLPPATLPPSVTFPPATTQPPTTTRVLPPSTRPPTVFSPPPLQSQSQSPTIAVKPAELDVQIAVVGSPPIIVGQDVKFQITVTNRGGSTANGLVITDRFDSSLQHAEADSPIEKDLPALAPGRRQTFAVTFRAARAGQLCHDVEVRGDGGVRGAARSCVEAVAAAAPPVQPPVTQPPPTTQQSPPATTSRPGLTVRVTGPASEELEGAAAFRIEVINSGDGPLTNVIVTGKYDPSLYPQQATDGYTWVEKDLLWKFPTMALGQKIVLQLNCKCLTAAAKACVTVKAAAQEGASAEGQACLQIRQPASQLTLEVSDLSDPLEVGKTATYDIRVENKGATADRNINLSVVLPPELSFQPLGSMGPGPKADGPSVGVLGEIVRFKPIPEIGAGQAITYKVKARAQKVGELRVEVILKSDGLASQISVEETTSVIAKP